ncbi:MAG TPA: carbon-nitrogen hydrolase family protein [Bryobacteraceae bacterium]|nr:carbon-nitrogen hydrolase family protein [Bryobacteraceae bacterium]
MRTVRIALANLPIPATREESISLAESAIEDAARKHADILCFPECYVPGYRTPAREMASPDDAFLQQAWSRLAIVAGCRNIAVILGTERFDGEELRISALVIDRDGSIAGFQDKVQLDPTEEGLFRPGSGRRIFRSGPLTFGISICHEGWRYPETVRWAVRQGAQIVFHPHFHQAEPDGYCPATFADPANTFHEKAALCRAAENTCFFATVNCASEGSPTTSAIIRPNGTLLSYQPYGKPGLLTADLDLREATGLLASRYRPAELQST